MVITPAKIRKIRKITENTENYGKYGKLRYLSEEKIYILADCRQEIWIIFWR